MCNTLSLAVFLCCMSFSHATEPFIFNVYRAESSTSRYSTHLQNANAADASGVLSYIHTEVIPQDMGSGQGHGCIRKWNIDTIMKFEVTVLNPPPKSTPPLGDFIAYDSGRCVNCQEIYDRFGYYVGHQFTGGNPRHRYPRGRWYSFPQKGFCTNPDGTKYCSYHARLVGKLKIDDLVNFLEEQITPDYNTWCQSNPANVELERIAINSGFSCGKFTEISIPFWRGLCNETLCLERVDELKNKEHLFNTLMLNGCDSEDGSRIYLHNGECVHSCPNYTYADWDYTCQPCNDPHCEKCNSMLKPDDIQGGKKCHACGDIYPFTLMDNEEPRCVSACPDSYYITNSKTCQPCHSSCRDCFGPTNRNCTTCPSEVNPYLDDGLCVATCLFCRTCTAVNDCTSCIDNTVPYALNGNCVAQCPKNYFVTQDKVCKECTDPAKPYMHINTCVAQCPFHYFANQDQTCQECSASCSNCNSSADTCTACDRNGTWPYLNGTICVKSCQSNWYSDSNYICNKCVLPCLTCTELHVCTTCEDGTTPYLFNDNCVANCPMKSFGGVDKVCHPCSPLCDRCNNTYCIKCSSDEYIMHEGMCLTDCPSGMAQNGFVCTAKSASESSVLLTVIMGCSAMVLIFILMLGFYRFKKHGSRSNSKKKSEEKDYFLAEYTS